MDYRTELENEKNQNVALLKVIHELQAVINQKDQKIYSLKMDNLSLKNKCEMYHANLAEQTKKNKEILKKVYK